MTVGYIMHKGLHTLTLHKNIERPSKPRQTISIDTLKQKQNKNREDQSIILYTRILLRGNQGKQNFRRARKKQITFPKNTGNSQRATPGETKRAAARCRALTRT